MTAVNESLMDAKDEACQAEVHADWAGALLTILDGQRQSDRAAFHRTMWLIATIIVSVASAAATIIGVLQ